MLFLTFFFSILQPSSKGEYLMGTGWYYAKDEQRKDIFVADSSYVTEKRGSIRFQLKKKEYPKAEVSTEFQIMLVDRPNYHSHTTVFGKVCTFCLVTFFKMQLIWKYVSFRLLQDWTPWTGSANLTRGSTRSSSPIAAPAEDEPLPMGHYRSGVLCFTF